MKNHVSVIPAGIAVAAPIMCGGNQVQWLFLRQSTRQFPKFLMAYALTVICQIARDHYGVRVGIANLLKGGCDDFFCFRQAFLIGAGAQLILPPADSQAFAVVMRIRKEGELERPFHLQYLLSF